MDIGVGRVRLSDRALIRTSEGSPPNETMHIELKQLQHSDYYFVRLSSFLFFFFFILLYVYIFFYQLGQSVWRGESRTWKDPSSAHAQRPLEREETTLPPAPARRLVSVKRELLTRYNVLLGEAKDQPTV